ncbi:hypothetical protein RchiOBHm_Chr5g0049461 [Rosa chinensis]|uniref:Uncharacterized protein n=1 Tax=Rosa chinensis TaxID=74649 RepID=A0A2P6QEV1_ROSCH|nr:hypothetical protein RchiOBHm_Chr5g0049461 [Rosa chinensis]
MKFGVSDVDLWESDLWISLVLTMEYFNRRIDISGEVWVELEKKWRCWVYDKVLTHCSTRIVGYEFAMLGLGFMTNDDFRRVIFRYDFRN